MCCPMSRHEVSGTAYSAATARKARTCSGPNSAPPYSRGPVSHARPASKSSRWKARAASMISGPSRPGARPAETTASGPSPQPRAPHRLRCPRVEERPDMTIELDEITVSRSSVRSDDRHGAGRRPRPSGTCRSRSSGDRRSTGDAPAPCTRQGAHGSGGEAPSGSKAAPSSRITAAPTISPQ